MSGPNSSDTSKGSDSIAGEASPLRGLPLQLDAQQFARAQGTLSGEADAALLERVAQECSNGQGRVAWVLDGRVEDDGACWLELKLSGALKLQCQRCLEDIDFGLDSVSRFRLVPAGEPWSDEDLEDDSFEALELDGVLDTRALVEDEVLLSLPAIALHDECSAPGDADGTKEGRPSPFAVLGQLKKNG